MSFRSIERPTWTSLDDTRGRLLFQLGLVLVGILEMAQYAFDKLYFGRELVGDVTDVWLPFANSVLAGGAPYLAHWDNKPPLFQFVNIAAAESGQYVLVFYLTMGLTNGVAAVFLWRLCRRYGYERIGTVAAVVFIAALATASFRINPRQYATVFILLALLTSSAVRSGVAIAAAGLFSQFSVFAIPAVVWLRYRSNDFTTQWFGIFVLAGLGIVIAVFSVVAAVWNVDAAVTGFQYSFLASGEYVGGYGGREISLYADPVGWVYNTYQILRDWGWGVIAIGALAGSVVVFTRRIYNHSGFGVAMILATIGLAFQMTIRPAPVYALAWLPFASVLAVIAAKAVLAPSRSTTGGGG